MARQKKMYIMKYLLNDPQVQDLLLQIKIEL
uniref:Uncharacterized protein n=1 Tax=virus sp. ctrcb4 TaxID=2825824 RepID=A0A8S5RQ06_9VIRU|nr:MAG TPA: hypothetical protein [virus sp. ctrcb4]